MILASAIDTEAFLLQIIMQLVIIIGAARLGGWLLARWGQPQVVGEIATGLLLGPSCLGRLNPELSGILFPAETSSSLLLLGQLGLILLMFIIGLEFDFGWLKKTGKTAAAVATCGMVLPFTLGALLAWSLHARLAAEHSLPGFVLFTATALSITAIPILGRIMMEFQITRTALGVLTISAAAIDDALGWILLAAVSSGIHGDFSLLPMTIMLGKTILFVLAIAFLVRPFCFWWLNRVIRQDQQELSLPAFSFILILVLLSAAATNWIGIFSVFGPFVLGAFLSDHPSLQQAVRAKMEQFVTAFFLPVFFTYTGLKTNMGVLDSVELWLICGLLIFTAIIGKTLGCSLAARWGGLSWRDSACVGVMMNTRALMGLIAINIGRELGVIPDSVFCMMVLMSIVTTIMTAPILILLLGKPDTPKSGSSASVSPANSH